MNERGTDGNSGEMGWGRRVIGEVFFGILIYLFDWWVWWFDRVVIRVDGSGF